MATQSKTMEMRGVWTALVTPMTSSGELDLEAFKQIVRDQKAAGVQGVIPCGTTGESPTLTADEKKKLIATALEELKGSGVGVIAGTGSNSTAETLALSTWASDQGVDGLLIVTPYYNKPTQLGMESHFLAVAEKVRCGIMLYNVPGRTGVSLTAGTIAKLASHPRIVALKEATANTAFTSEIFDALSGAGRKLQILSGDDATFLPLLSVGAAGVVSVASNLFPRGMVAIQKAFESSQNAKALELHNQYYPLFRDLFIESNPGPIKAAMEYAGWCRADLRLPLARMTEESWKKLEAALRRCGIRRERAAQ